MTKHIHHYHTLVLTQPQIEWLRKQTDDNIPAVEREADRILRLEVRDLLKWI
jgi:hypothetical protein